MSKINLEPSIFQMFFITQAQFLLLRLPLFIFPNSISQNTSSFTTKFLLFLSALSSFSSEIRWPAHVLNPTLHFLLRPVELSSSSSSWSRFVEPLSNSVAEAPTTSGAADGEDPLHRVLDDLKLSVGEYWSSLIFDGLAVIKEKYPIQGNFTLHRPDFGGVGLHIQSRLYRHQRRALSCRP